MELKAIILFLIIVTAVYGIATYKPVDSEVFGLGAPSLKSVITFIIFLGLFIFGLYLNDNPIFI